MTTQEKLHDINDTIKTISSYCIYAQSIDDAEYTADNIGAWLDQLRKEIDEHREIADSGDM